MEGGCLGYPGASTVASQPLDRKAAPMAGKSLQPSHEPPFQAPITLMKQWKEEKGDWEGGKMLNDRSTKTTVQTLKLTDPSCIQNYTNHVSLHLWDIDR